jgi:hypothetical protein
MFSSLISLTLCVHRIWALWVKLLQNSKYYGPSSCSKQADNASCQYLKSMPCRHKYQHLNKYSTGTPTHANMRTGMIGGSIQMLACTTATHNHACFTLPVHTHTHTHTHTQENERRKRTGKELLVAGLCLPKALSPLLPVFLQGMLQVGGHACSCVCMLCACMRARVCMLCVFLFVGVRGNAAPRLVLGVC